MDTEKKDDSHGGDVRKYRNIDTDQNLR